MKTEELEESQVAELCGGPLGLAVVHSPDEGLRERFFALDDPVTIGRADDDACAGIAVADARISRNHASVQRRSDGRGCEVRDLGSRNGTFVGRQRVSSHVAHAGDILRVGDTFFEVGLRPGGASDPALRGRSALLVRLIDDIARVAASDLTLLIEGETGTGKELVASAIYALSGRRGRLVAVNCASIPAELAESYLFGHKKGSFTGASADVDGVFAQAEDGTLFLDEIGELRVDLQAKLLRVLETRQFTPVGASSSRSSTARVIAATNARLRSKVTAGSFRSDLFARLAGVELAVPALRQRRCDIPILIAHFFALAAPGVELSLSPNALESLLLHDWPMNVRELKAICQRLALRHPDGGRLRSADLAAVLRDPAVEIADTPGEPAAGSAPARVELAALLTSHRGNVVKLAAHYGKDRKQIYRWLEQHHLDPRDFR